MKNSKYPDECHRASAQSILKQTNLMEFSLQRGSKQETASPEDSIELEPETGEDSSNSDDDDKELKGLLNRRIPESNAPELSPEAISNIKNNKDLAILLKDKPLQNILLKINNSKDKESTLADLLEKSPIFQNFYWKIVELLG